MEFTVTDESDYYLLKVEGSIDSKQNEEFDNIFDELAYNKTYRVILDASDITYLNSRAVGRLVAFASNARIAGGRLVMACPSNTVNKIFRSVGLDSIVPCLDSLIEAKELVVT